MAEYREAGTLQDSLQHPAREESSSKKKRLQAMHKQKSLDISNTDSILFNLDEHRRKSCIDRCDLQGPPPPPPSCSSSTTRQSRRADRRAKESSEGSNLHFDNIRPVIPEVRLSCMETFEDKSSGLDSPLAISSEHAHGKEDGDLIDLSSDCTSIPEKRSILSLSDSDSLVFEPLPPLRIVESDEDLFEALSKPPIGMQIKSEHPSPSSASTIQRLSPLFQVSVEDCSKERTCKSISPAKGSPVQAAESRNVSITPTASLELPDPIYQPGLESPMTLKQKRDLLRKSPHVPDTSVDYGYLQSEDKAGGSPSGKSVYLNIPEDTLESLDPLKAKKEEEGGAHNEDENYAEDDEDSGDDRESEPKPEDESDEAEFKIQIVPRQRKQRKIAVSAIQREYLDISFNTMDKIGEQTTDSGKQFCDIAV